MAVKVRVSGSTTAGVEAVLHELLGAAAVAELIEAGRYRRDVY